jgi:3-methyladenine DNA glycosylase AlkD
MNPKTQVILLRLQSLANPTNLKGMARYGINTHNTLGISIYVLRPIAKEIGVDHSLALELWDTGIHEARLLAAFIDDPGLVTEKQMEHWASGFDSWDVCDQVCSSLFDQTPYAIQKAYQWSERPEEFVKRAGFVLMAALSVHNKLLPDDQFAEFLKIIIRESSDPRNFVKKAVNWALRNIGKRSLQLNQCAIQTAREIQIFPTKPARWIASDALRELTNVKIQAKLTK